MAKSIQSRTVGIGLLGLGTVGGGVYKILKAHGRAIEKKTGLRLVVKKVCVKSFGKKRPVTVPRALLTRDANALIQDPSVDILVELIGGIHPAKEWIQKAFAAGKHVVTANKALLAEQGRVIFREAARHSRCLGLEASVCGGIPIIKSLKEGLASNTVSHFLGIVNGTCNFILTSMSRDRLSFDAALAQAQAKGYAEKNPRLDIEGIDSAHKLAILARLAFDAEVPFKAISTEGIKALSITDIEYARELGYVLKLLAIGKRVKGGLELRVHPTLLPLSHPLATVRGVYNAVYVRADQTGDLLFYGKGAGMMPTASAVISDIISIAQGGQPSGFNRPAQAARVLPMDDLRSKYYLRFQVADKPGVLGRIAQTLGRHGISIMSVHQKESHDPRSVPVVILTYEASERDLKKALKEIDSKKDISRKTVLIRVEK